MSEQQSSKSGLRSSSQKEGAPRDTQAPSPPSKVVPGAFGQPKPKEPSDRELALAMGLREVKDKKKQ